MSNRSLGNYISIFCAVVIPPILFALMLFLSFLIPFGSGANQTSSMQSFSNILLYVTLALPVGVLLLDIKLATVLRIAYWQLVLMQVSVLPIIFLFNR